MVKRGNGLRDRQEKECLERDDRESGDCKRGLKREEGVKKERVDRKCQE